MTDLCEKLLGACEGDLVALACPPSAGPARKEKKVVMMGLDVMGA
jgi:hypothetical protein